MSLARGAVSPRVAAAIAVGAALLVAALWFGRRRSPVLPTALEGTRAIRLTRHDALGQPSKPERISARARVRTIVAALDVDLQPPSACPSDYASAEVGLTLEGADVYARRSVYLWNVVDDAGAGPPTVLVVTEAGCASGPPADTGAARQEIRRGGD